MPRSIISCYSGEDIRLWNSTYKSYYKDFFNKAIQSHSYIPKLLYINKYCWKIALIALLYSENIEVKDFLTNKLGINVNDVKIRFTRRAQESEKAHDASTWYNEVETKLGNGEISILDLKDIDLNETQDVDATIDQRIFYYLYFLSMPEKNPAIGLRADKLIEDIRITIDGNIDFDNLSEGEKKLILIECITKVLGEKESLLLLDEPDAHTHIARKKELLDAIETFEGQTILTTHSPVFTTLINKNDIFPISEGRMINAEQRDLIVKLANNNINYIDGACIMSSKHLVLTEGPGDINYITSAITACGKDEAKYKMLDKMSFVYIGGANQVKAFNDDILSKMYDTLESIVFIFDYDVDGRNGAKHVQELIDSGQNKIKILYYNKTYPINLEQDFYLEDMFDRRVYNVVQLPSINGEPTYAQLKKGAALAKSIKDKIAKLYDDKSLNDDEYYSFKPFLDELIKLSNL